MRRSLCFGNNHGIKIAFCPKCGRKLEHDVRGSQRFSAGMYDEDIEEGYVCPNGDYEEWENDYQRVTA